MKSKKKIIFPLLITIVIGVILILGIMWVNKHYLNKKDIENFNASEGQNLGKNILAGATAQMEAAGVDTSNIDKQLESAFDQLGDLITNEKDVIADQNGLFESEMDSTGSVIDTTTVKYNDKTFFEGSRFSDGFCQTSGGTNNPNDLNRKCGRILIIPIIHIRMNVMAVAEEKGNLQIRVVFIKIVRRMYPKIV